MSFSHTWLHLLQLTVTTWLHSSNRQLKITNHSAQYYATMVLFPQQDAAGLEGVQHVFKHILRRIRNSMVWHLEGEHPPGSNKPLIALIKPLKRWAVSDTVINWDTCINGLETAAKQTGFRRYRKWHENFLKCTIDDVDDAEYIPPFQNNFFAHNDAVGRAVRNETNDTLQETRQEQQCKHISFEAAPTGRLAVSSLYYTVPHSPAKRQFGEPVSQDAHDLPTDDFDFSSLNDIDEDICSGKQKRTAGDDPLCLWNSNADLFLLEFICLEGCVTLHKPCVSAGKQAQCIGAKTVMVQSWIECWNGTSFQITMLKALGVHFQLGHPISVQCVNPIPTFNDDFVILNYNGVHEVGLDFCGCESAQPHITQLLHVCLFPTTTLDPKSAATFRMLEYFQMLSFESKVSAWVFYNMVARLTDNTGTRVLKDRYVSLLRMIREWRFVMQMKHCGQGHHPGGIQATEASACAVLCPACPHPSRNLPVGWENSPLEFQ
ncbi:hypothetical protein BDR07DRAFT_1480611 [Suillus spraguei]|nr:hypothetical protein BDR07DRAFT_1480611 [Suillus spraguei]